ncbi:coronin-7, partial [Phenoliferia sp. Uapishka_3]
MAPRFYSSPYKNAVAQTAKKESWWSELPVSTNAYSDSSELIKTSGEYWLAQASAAGALAIRDDPCHALGTKSLASMIGHLICLPYDTPGKFNSRPQTLQVSSGVITDFDVSPFDDLVVAGSDNGQITINALPSLSSFTPSQPLSPSPLATLTHPTGRGIDTLSFHTTTSSLLLASSKATVVVFDVSNPAPVFTIEQSSPIWSAKWSGDGRSVSVTTKDGFLRLFDVRSNSSSASMETAIHQGQKCSRHVWLGSDQIFTTGFSKMREREYALYDGRNLGKAIKSQRVDTGTAAFIPVADVERGIVYFAGKGDMTMRWVEIGGPSTFTDGGAPLGITIAGVALAPSSTLNLMKAEINRLIVLTTDAVVPIPIEVPRRQYVDFHQDLFPPVRSREPAQDSKAWLSGQDALLDLEPQDPSRKSAPIKRAPAPVATPSPVVAISAPSSPPAVSAPPAVKEGAKIELKIEAPSTPVAPTSAPTPAPTPASAPAPPSISSTATTAIATPPRQLQETTAKTESAPPPEITKEVETASQKPIQTQSTGSAPSPTSKPTPSPAPSPQILKTPNTSEEPFNPGWSRKFLAGKTALKPDYHDVHGLATSMGADTQMLKANQLYFFFPLAGAGGRLGVHPVAAKGRLPTLIPSLVCGAGIVDFELDPFDPRRVFVASDDSKIRVFRIPEEGLEADHCEVELTLSDGKMDRIGELKHHPTANNLLLSVSDDHAHPTLRLWDLETGDLIKKVEVPAKGVSSIAWSPDGNLLAVATKSKAIIILDPRSSSEPISTPSHDSIRPVRLAWLSPTHLISTGFSRSATREFILYSASPSSITKLGTQSLDVSPAPLFPYADIDTSILLLYSRGERSCHAFEVQPHDPKNLFGRLPSFEHGTLQAGFAFLNKQRNDIKGCEIIKALRLTPQTVEAVSFSVPRARAEFFQDDIFVKTRDLETPALGAKEWIEGRDAKLRRIDLNRDGLLPLSQAPITAAKASTRSKITGPVVTESQKQEQYLERAAQVEDDDDEVGRKTQVGMAAPDDEDW